MVLTMSKGGEQGPISYSTYRCRKFQASKRNPTSFNGSNARKRPVLNREAKDEDIACCSGNYTSNQVALLGWDNSVVLMKALKVSFATIRVENPKDISLLAAETDSVSGSDPKGQSLRYIWEDSGVYGNSR
nr:hypothetical protein Iba_chr14cCG7190 [Ipomoea batatas]